MSESTEWRTFGAQLPRDRQTIEYRAPGLGWRAMTCIVRVWPLRRPMVVTPNGTEVLAWSCDEWRPAGGSDV